jgi:predicted site-specific integrase-resolvase
MLISSGTVWKKFEISRVSLEDWFNKGLIRRFPTPGGHYRYLEKEIMAVLNVTAEDLQK